jgi:transketolase
MQEILLHCSGHARQGRPGCKPSEDTQVHIAPLPQTRSGVDRDLRDLATTIRRLTIVALYHAGSGHPGGALSATDLLAQLYGVELNLWPEHTQDPDRDRFVLSKGHACPALYAAWVALGYAEKPLILSLRKLGGPFQGHPHVLDTPLAETSTGSLGQGFSAAIGMAIGLRRKISNARVYAMLGDGELQEGEVWEGAMCAGHYGLGNLCAVIDYNKLQSDDRNECIMSLEPLADKWRAFRWRVIEIDGHDMEEMSQAFSEARRERFKPTVVIAHTIKGRGVPFMENLPAWHGSVKLSREDCERALRSLGVSPSEIDGWIDGTRH